MSVTVKVTDKELRKALRNIAQWSEAKKKRIATVVTTSAMNVERVAKELAPVDTGRLRAAITREPVGLALEATVTNNVEYAVHQEFGTRYMAGTPHMNPAAERERPNFTKKIRAAMKADERVV